MTKNFFGKVFGLAILSASLIFSGCGSSASENLSTQTAEAQNKIQGQFPQFTATDLNGEKVTSEIFAQKKITVLNIWGTFCPPCIGEMPELGEWNKNLPADAQLVGLVCDVGGADDAKTIDDAKKILEQADAKFLNIVPSEDIISFLQNIDAVPTTIFIDAQGNIIGEPVIGAQVPEYKKKLQELLK